MTPVAAIQNSPGKAQLPIPCPADVALTRELHHLSVVASCHIGFAVGTDYSAFWWTAHELLRCVETSYFVDLLTDDEPVVRCIGAYCLVRRDAQRFRPQLENLANDSARIWLQIGSQPAEETTVSGFVSLLLADPQLLECNENASPTATSSHATELPVAAERAQRALLVHLQAVARAR